MHKINIIIPMAGEGKRFAEAGYPKAKPFINVLGRPMIKKVMENLACPQANFILVLKAEHLEQERDFFHDLKNDFDFDLVTVPQTTEGTACSVLYARQFINNEIPLLIANSDQIVDISIKDFISDCTERNLDGSILVFKDEARDPKWSFARVDSTGLVNEVKEKVAISDLATVGIYYFSQGRYFVDGAIDMIINRDRVNGEFYTCPVYNYLIKVGKKIGVFKIPQELMHGLGVPADLEKYLELMSV